VQLVYYLFAVKNPVGLIIKLDIQKVKAHEMQRVRYLTLTGKHVGLIINSGETKVDIKRRVKDFTIISHFNYFNLTFFLERKNIYINNLIFE